MQAFVYDTLSGLGTLAGAAFGYFFLADAAEFVPSITALAAAGFIAIADLFPHLHRKNGSWQSLRPRRRVSQIATGYFGRPENLHGHPPARHLPPVLSRGCAALPAGRERG